jgi:lipopolysaccharide biosynthesis regulator YciM
MDSYLLYSLIVVAIGIGWLLGRWERLRGTAKPAYRGLNYLLNEQNDRAVASFIQDLEVNQETLETHLALGSLLRRRGELDKAVVVHENILTRARLGRDVMLGVQLELARDYLLAGLLDRAETVVQELIKEKGPIRLESLEMLIEIYEREKDWTKAIATADQLLSAGTNESVERAVSHYYCELADKALSAGELPQAEKLLDKGECRFAANARICLLKGHVAFVSNNYQKAINELQQINGCDPVFTQQSIDLLRQCYEERGDGFAEFGDYLARCLETNPSISIVLAMADLRREHDGDEGVSRFIADYLKRNPTIRGLTRLIDLHMDNATGVSRENLAILRSFADALVAEKPGFRCDECGFSVKKMHWHCPGCHDWGSVKPIFGLEGE